MTNIDTRSSFFPNTKTKTSSNPLAETLLKRNSPDRVKELNTYAKSDSKVDISDAIKDFAKIKRVADSAPEVDNSDKIARLKSQIQAGTYKVDYDALADKILSEEV
ncbi:flagellar biosynthesis anti-sigma factor FlgM [Halobacteriovorax sp. GB3]|uniref:flagellar biosynthesis anti-sigma factor FlgM n=1 Tax=Halobacteriovorax sp. GB3 TaxID=2719615 RepID=UPI00235E8332|nr:flagellar biosynthesis anti-sigma factor FlgM [Halobacteriovorax sp. GB3]MDD0854820.1 flagellar biosynthesis anti-sigma factor FlgM [Halobacteriovorax sp. GB3]